MKKGTITWIPVSSGELPPPTKEGKEATNMDGNSDRVLLKCSDGIERFGRYLSSKYLTRWNVEGCAGQPADFVTHYAYMNNPDEK